ncbi:hypothetical protein [Hoeflea olei]|uniref:Uncharacterized protein n=1 Tax=Hoeflea olei TaxID=1480615 RepID=A0A1C1YRW5_9HYPH|nr:hypothetical protein [Hoeflea olei]OCW56275.1 hypothetical protein AWJ14_19465 [Hoeflea olei]
MTNEFIRHDPLSRHPEEVRDRIRQLYLRANQIALAVEDGVDLDVLSDRAGVGRQAIIEIMHGHIHDVDEPTIKAIEDAVAGIVGAAA